MTDTIPRRRGRLPGDQTGNRGGGARPRGSSRRIHRSVRIDPDLTLRIECYAELNDVTFNETINILLSEALQRHKIDSGA